MDQQSLGPLEIPALTSENADASHLDAPQMFRDLDLWYELWERAGSQVSKPWYELRGEAQDGRAPGQAPDVEGPEATRDGPPEGA